MAEVDLERLAAGYGHRPDAGGADRADWAAAAASLGPGDLLVDVGGGRGGHAARIASTTGCRAVVADPSPAMNRAAREVGIPVVRATGESLPFADGLAAMTYFHLSIHHGDWRRMLAEAWRVTRPGGVVFVWTMDPAYHRRSLLSEWFPRVGEIDATRFPAPSDLVAEMRGRGGTPTTSEHVERVRREAGAWADAVRAGFVSTLHLLAPGEIEEGLARFAAAHPDPHEILDYRLEFTSISSVRPPVES